jgi:hypothetical protein
MGHVSSRPPLRFRTSGFPQYGSKRQAPPSSAGAFRAEMEHALTPDPWQTWTSRRVYASLRSGFDPRGSLDSGDETLALHPITCALRSSLHVGSVVPLFNAWRPHPPLCRPPNTLPSTAGYRVGLWQSRTLLPGLQTFRTFVVRLSRIAAVGRHGRPDTCLSPFFRVGTGHRGGGRDPWRLLRSRHQLHAGKTLRGPCRSLSLRPSWLLAPWTDPTEPPQPALGVYVRAASNPGHPGDLPDMTTAPHEVLR